MVSLYLSAVFGCGGGSRFSLMVRRSAGKRKDAGSTHISLQNLRFMDTCLVTLPCTNNETLKRLTSLPILINAEIILVVTV